MMKFERQNEKHVRFTPLVEVKVFDRIDPALKADLYYSKEEMHIIQKRFQIATSLRRQEMEPPEKFKESKVCVDYLTQKSETNERKHVLPDQSRREPVLLMKRRRLQ